MNSRRATLSVPYVLRQKDGNDTQKSENPVNSNLSVKAIKPQTTSSKMPILDDPSLESLEGNWVRSVLLEKERQLINNNNGCDVHEKCISTQKLKVDCYVSICL